MEHLKNTQRNDIAENDILFPIVKFKRTIQGREMTSYRKFCNILSWDSTAIISGASV